MDNYLIESFFLLDKPSIKQIEFIEEYNKLIANPGISLLYKEPDEYVPHHRLTFVCNLEQANDYRSRGAGRREKMLNDYQLLRVAEVKAMMAEKTADEVAAELGISRSTLFRRLKKDDDRLF